MKSKNYTIMIIPDDEKKSWSFHLRRLSAQTIGFLILFLVSSCLLILSIYIPRINNYEKYEKEYKRLISERLKVVELYEDLKRVSQMDEMIRNSLGSTLELEDPALMKDSLFGLYEEPLKQISYLENVPSYPPIQGFISQRLSNKGYFLKDTHHGIDIVSKEGDPILAAASGVIVFSGWTYDYGNMVIIYHGDDYFTHYGHNKKNLKQQLDFVDKGEIIGLVGTTGISSGPHLHFEIWREFQPVDPLEYFPEYATSDITFQND